MKHIYPTTLALFCLFLFKNAYAQNINAPCGTDYWREKTLQDPAFFQKDQEYEQGILQVFQQKKASSGLPENIKILPAVIHIIHDGGIENISDAQAQQAILWLNQALANQGSFNQGSGADCGIQLCLAQRTPDGQLTNGITRNQSPLTVMLMGTQDILVKNLNRWKPKDYVNIWLVRSICSNATNCGVVGYSFFPYTHGTNIDGIVMEAGYVTDVNKIKGLAHELGHYLGLYHTFEGGCTNNNCLTQGDRICDTPPDKSIASVPCGQTVSTCTSDTQSGPFTTDQPDMTWNFMDYGIIACFHDFTPDQATRMNATVDGIRSSLLVSKGCLPPCPTPTMAGFTASATTIAPGETVNFSNTSQNASSFDWTLNGTSFGNQPNASYTFTAPGTYTVVLTAQSANTFLCFKDTASVVIQVICNVAASFTVSNLSPETNETITLTNTSQNATQTEWFVNGVSQGSTLDSLVFSNSGTFEIMLVAQNGLCKVTSTVDVVVKPFCEEDNRLFQMSYKGPQQLTTNGMGVIVLSDGNILFLVRSLTTNGFVRIGLIKKTPAGQQLWAKSLGNSIDQYTTYGGLAATSDGGFAITFSVEGSDSYAAIGKFSSDGDLLWMRQSIEGATFYNLVTTPDGKITACGNFPSQNESMALFVQLDATGALLWVKKYEMFDLGAFTIKVTPDGGFVGTGKGGTLFRLSPLGEMLWHKRIQGTFLTDVVVLSNGEMVACGGTGTLSKGIFVKLDQNGSPSLFKQYSTVTNGTYFKNIIKDGDQGFILTTVYLASVIGLMSGLDSLGNVRWTRKYQSQLGGAFSALTAYKDIGLILTGDWYEPGITTAWILKTDRKGRIGDCPSEPFTLTVTDMTIPGVIESISSEVPPLTLVQTTVAVNPWPVMRDTLCSFSCVTPNEICNNNLDDDNDGLFDCLDPDCACEENQCKPKEAEIWYFGNHAGLDFSTEPPTVLKDGMTESRGISATMNDANGNLIFYAGDNTVYNRFHQPMPNGDLQIVDNASVLIIPHPGNASLYYVFHSTAYGYIFYSLVDMTLDEGRGDVVQAFKKITLTILASGLSAVKSCAFKGYWLLIQKQGSSSQFWAYRINQFGIDNLDPIKSSTGQPVAYVNQMKISPDGNLIVCAVKSQTPNKYSITIHNFDAYTSGEVLSSSNLEEYVSPNGPMGVEFSPQGRYLYVTGNFDGLAKVLQYDLFAGGLDAIRNSKVVIEAKQSTVFGYPQLAPNGKIYLSSGSNFAPVSFFLDVIHQPNLPGLSCQYQASNVYLSPSSVGFGLCNFIASSFKTPHIAFPSSAPDTICALNTPINYHIWNVQCNVDSITWQTENLNAAIQPNYQYATIRYLSPGSGRLIITAHTPCGTASDTLNVLVVAPLNKTLNLGPDLTVCDNGVFSFNAGSGFTRYQWSDGTADSTTTTLFPGKYWVNVWDLCRNLQTDTITVSIAPNSVLDLGADLPQQCSGYSVSYQRPANFAFWKWSPADVLSCSDCPNVTLSPTTSTTWVVVAETSDGCVSVDSLSAIIRDTLLFSRDTSVCVGQTLALFGAYLPADTTAQFYFPAPGLGCDSLLTVNVLGIENAASAWSVTICPNAVFDFNGTLLPADTVAVFHYPSALSCDSAVTVTINAYPPLNLTLPMDTTIRVGASVLLNATITGTGTLDFVWSPADALSCINCLDPLANPLDTITYTLAVTDGNGCTAEESVTVRVNEECRVEVPNAFTPNGDGSNDLFRPIMDPCVRTVRLWRILNRWGQTVFEQVNFPATDPALGWDGNWEGKSHPSDVLIWVAEFQYYDGRRESQKGAVTLIR